MSKTVVITGSNGYIGSVIAKKFKEEHYNVIGIDLDKCYNSSVDTLVNLDLSNNQFPNVMQSHNDTCDIIIHCAALLDSTIESFMINIKNTLNILNYGLLSSCKQFIYISSIPIIGRPESIPITETHTVNPMTLYHCSKYFGERLLAMPEFSFMSPVILRLSSPIGGLSVRTEKKILPSFLRACQDNAPITLLGKGQRIQNYIDIKDIANATWLAATNPTKQSGLFLIQGHSISNLELAKKCIQLTNSLSGIVFSQKADPEENHQWVIDGIKAKKSFGYEPQIPIEKSILRMRELLR